MKASRQFWLSFVLLGCCAIPPSVQGQEELQIFRDGASYQNNEAFELAIEEWNKFLAEYADNKLALDARYNLGVCQIQLKRLTQAVATFTQVATDADADFKHLENTYLNLASSQYTLGLEGDPEMFVQAIESYDLLLQKFPEGNYADSSLYYQGESYYALDKKQEAVAAYQRLADAHADSALRRDGLYALGVTLEELEDHARAGDVYDQYLDEYAEHELATEVRMRKAETLLQSDQIDQASELFGQAAGVAGFALADHALFRQAFCLVKQDENAAAAEVYARIATDFVESKYAAEATLAAGRLNYRLEQFDEARPWLEKVVAAGGPDAPEAAHWLARIHLRQDRVQDAVDLAVKTIPAAAESPYLVNLFFDEADALFEIADQRASAIEKFLAIVQQYPEHELAGQALYNAGFGALELSQYDAAVKHAADFAAAFPDHGLTPDMNHVAAESQLLLKDHAAAESIYRDLVADHAEHAEWDNWKVRWGRCLYLQQKYEETVQALQPQLEGLQSPDNLAEAHFLIGTSQLKLGQHDSAAASLQASLAAKSDWRQADETLLNLSLAQQKQEKLNEAIATVQKMFAEHADSPLLAEGHYRLAQYSYANQDFAGAVSDYTLVVEQWPESTLVPYSHYGRGWALLRQMKYAAAAESLTALISGFADHQLIPQARQARSICRQRSEDFQGGIEDATEYLKSNPSRANKTDALYVRGLCEAGLQDHAAAITTFEQILNENRNYARAGQVLYELAWAYKSNDRNDEAIQRFSQLVEQHPDNDLAGESHYHIGQARYDQREYEQAATSFAAVKQAVAAGELEEKAMYMLGWARFQLQEYEAALTEFSEQSSKYDSGSHLADALFMIAECLFQMERYAESYAGYEKAQSVPATSADREVLIQLHGGQAAVRLERWADAIRWLEQIPAKHSDSDYVADAQFEQGVATQALEQWDPALQLFGQAAAKSRGVVGARARFRMGEVQFAKKDFAPAVKEYQRVMFGYGGDNAPETIKPFQAMSGFQAGQASLVLAGQADNQVDKQKYVDQGRKFLAYVVGKHPTSAWATKAAERLKAL